jgi:3-hydroxyacyl-[acyl-carrier-protein] dehydratase
LHKHPKAKALHLKQDILDYLPHRPPFRFLTEVLSLTDEYALGQWVLDGTEDFFEGHFPNQPLLPGVLITESLAQLAGFIPQAAAIIDADNTNIAEQTPRSFRLAQIEMRFEKSVSPPLSLTLEAKVERTLGSLWLFNVQAKLGDDSVARGSLTLSLPSTRADT